MTWIDYTVIVVLVVSIAWGAWRGLVHEMLSLIGWILAFAAGNLFAAPLAEMLPSSMSPGIRVVVAYVSIFVGTLVVAALLSAFVTRWHLASLGGARGAAAEELARHVNGERECFETPGAAFAAALKRAHDDDKIVVFGSFLTVGEVLEWLKNKKTSKR